MVDPSKVLVCHCTDCQQFSGAPFRAVLPTPIEDVSMKGEAKQYVKVAASGNKRVQAFCAECGTQLYATEPDSPKLLNLRLGCVNERAQLAPSVQIGEGGRFDCYLLDPESPLLPKYTAYLDRDIGLLKTQLIETIKRLKTLKSTLNHRETAKLNIHVHSELLTASFFLFDSDEKRSKALVNHKFYACDRHSSYGFEVYSKSHDLFKSLGRSVVALRAASKEVQ